MYADQLDQLRTDFGRNKSLPAEFELAALIALSKFPELKDLKIDIVYANIKTTLEARPAVGSVFKRKAKRRYQVIINANEERIKRAALKYAPFNAQVGILAHEFAHIRLYNKKNMFALMGIGFSYFVSRKFREKFEKENDRETISRDFGWQVHNFTSYLLNDAGISAKYRKYKERVYYTPDELQEIIESELVD